MKKLILLEYIEFKMVNRFYDSPRSEYERYNTESYKTEFQIFIIYLKLRFIIINLYVFT